MRNRVYAIVENENGGVFVVRRRAAPRGSSISEDRDLRQRAFYYTRIYADPKAKDTVYVLNVGFYKSTTAARPTASSARRTATITTCGSTPSNPAAHDREQRRRRATSRSTAARRGPARQYPTAQLYHVATTRDIPYHVCGAQQDSSTICVSSAAAGGRGGGGGGRAP